MQNIMDKVVDGITYVGTPEILSCTGCVGDNHDYLCDRLCEGPRCFHNWSKKPIEQPIQKALEPSQGVKFDDGKTLYSLVPPYALEAVAKNLTVGLKKYPARNNWMLVNNAQERYLDALMRHLEQHRKGEIYDTENIDPTTTHLSAVAVNAMFLLELMLNPSLKDTNGTS